jgi:hypothetical protein
MVLLVARIVLKNADACCTLLPLMLFEAALDAVALGRQLDAFFLTLYRDLSVETLLGEFLVPDGTPCTHALIVNVILPTCYSTTYYIDLLEVDMHRSPTAPWCGYPPSR